MPTISKNIAPTDLHSSVTTNSPGTIQPIGTPPMRLRSGIIPSAINVPAAIHSATMMPCCMNTIGR